MKDVNESDSNINSLLSKHFVLFVGITLSEFLISQILLFTYGKTVCHADYVREPWTRDINLLVCGAFILKFVLQSFRIWSGISNSERNIRSSFYSALAVSFIAGTSTLTTLFNSQGVCVDSNGYVHF